MHDQVVGEELQVGRQSRRIEMPRRRAEIFAVIEGPHHPRRVAGGLHLHGGGIARPLFAAAIQRQRGKQPARGRRVPVQQGVEDADRTGDAALPARPGRPQAKQPDDIGRIAVKVDIARGAIAPHHRIVPEFVIVRDMAEQVVRRILRARHAQMVADEPVRQRRLVIAPGRHRQAAHHDEAAPRLQPRPPLCRRCQKLRHGEAPGGDIRHGGPAGARTIGGRAKRRDSRFGQHHLPVLCRSQVGRAPGRRRQDRPGRRTLVGPVEIVDKLFLERPEPGHRAPSICLKLRGWRARRAGSRQARRGTGAATSRGPSATRGRSRRPSRRPSRRDS